MQYLPTPEVWNIIFNENPIGIAFLSKDGGYLKVNQCMTEMLGYSEPELLRMKFSDITHFQDLSAETALFDRLKNEEGLHYEMLKRFSTKREQIIWVKITVWRVYEMGDTMYIKHVIPITNGMKTKLEQIGDKALQIRPTISIKDFITDNIKEFVLICVFTTSVAISLGVAIYGNLEKAKVLEERIIHLEGQSHKNTGQ